MKREKHMRMFDELTKKEQKTLRAIKNAGDIKSVKQVGDEWRDDHVTCVGAEINGIEIGFWWCGDKLSGYLDCAFESITARVGIFDALHHDIEMAK